MSSKTSRAWSACSSFPTAGAKFRSSSKPVKSRSASAVREKFSAPAEPALHAILISSSKRSKSDVSEPINPLVTAKIRAVFGADLTLIALAPLAGDASSRRYYRAILSGTGAPPSIIVMELPAGSSLPLSSEELAIFKEGPKELPFLNVHRFLSRTGVNVPQILGAWEKDGILLLEDLGDTALWDRVQGLAEDDIVGWYQKAIDELLKIQIRGTENRDGSCIAFQQRFDFKLYMWEFEHFIEWGLEKRPGSVVNAQHDGPAKKIVCRHRRAFGPPNSLFESPRLS